MSSSRRIATIGSTLLSGFLFACALCGLAVPVLGAGRDRVFDDVSVGEIRATMDPADLAWLLDPDHAESNAYLPAVVHFQNAHYDREFPGAGIRLRGNYGRYAVKKSFKLALDRDDPGAELGGGVDRLNLVGEHNDPTILREKLALDAYRSLGLPAARAAHFRFFLNGEYRGLYLVVEEVDRGFLIERFGSAAGNLYKCQYVDPSTRADLVYRAAEDYEFLGDPEKRVYELESDRRPDSFTDLAELIDVLNNTPGSELPAELEEELNVAGFLRCVAVEVAIGSWDDYWCGGNNYLLFHNPVERRFEFLPRDCDMTFGINSINSVDYGRVDVYRFGRYDLRVPLVYRLLEEERYRNLFTHFLEEVLAGPLDPATLRARGEVLRARIRPAALADTYRTRDFPFIDYAAFDRGFEEALGGHCPYGLYPFMTTRAGSAEDQLDWVSAPPAVWGLHAPRFVAPGAPIPIRVEAFDSGGIAQVKGWVDRGAGFTSHTLYDDGQHGDGMAGDHCFGRAVAGGAAGAEVRLYVEVRDGSGQEALSPLESPDDARTLIMLENGPLVLNELMAENETIIADDHGEFEDWVELWNAGPGAVDLSRFELIDDPVATTGWRLPAINLAAGGRVLLWLDDEPTEGSRHAPFALDHDGEWLVLGERSSGGTIPYDAIVFPALGPDRAYGRVRDGDPEWDELRPTPGEANAPLVVGPGETPADPEPGPPPLLRILTVAPNPFADEAVVSCQAPPGPIVLEVVDAAGRLRRRINSEGGLTERPRLLLWDGRDAAGNEVPDGSYFLRLRAGATETHARVTVLR